MATRADLQKAVDDTTAATTAARTTWKDAIPGPDAPKMTDAEQAEVDVLEEAYSKAKAARKAAERALADFDTAETAKKAAAAAAAPVGAAPVSEVADAWVSYARRMGYNVNSMPAGWTPPY